MDPTVKQLMTVVFSGAIGKLVVDQFKKLANLLNITLNPLIVRALTVPGVYLVLLVVSLVTKQPLNDNLLNAVVETISAALIAVGVHEWSKKEGGAA